MENVTMAQIMYNIIGSQTFANWYNEGGAFDKHISGADDAKSKAIIIGELADMIKSHKLRTQ